MNTVLMMKKVRFSVAMAVIAVAMVSCGNGPQQKIEVPEVRLEEPGKATNLEAGEIETGNKEYDFEYFSVKGQEGWAQTSRPGRLRLEKGGASLSISNSSISFEELQKRYAVSHKKQDDITIGGITWQVYADEKSNLYALITDIPNEPDKAMDVFIYHLKPDNPELQKILATIKLK